MFVQVQDDRFPLLWVAQKEWQGKSRDKQKVNVARKGEMSKGNDCRLL
jgi:hypothetical protein